jgi:hypothetical protein
LSHEGTAELASNAMAYLEQIRLEKPEEKSLFPDDDF